MEAGARRGLAAWLAGCALVTGAALPALVFAQATAAPSAATTARSYDLAAGPLGRTVSTVAVEGGLALSFDTALTDGRQSPALLGSFTPAEALRRLLVGSGLELIARTDNSYTLRRLPPSAGDVRTLAPVTVTATAAGELSPAFPGQQVARGGSLGVLGNVDIMDSPYSQSAYTATWLRNQQAATVADALRADPTIATVGSNTMFEAFLVRGFDVGPAAGDGQGPIQVNGMFGLVPNYANQVGYAERIEVLRGPSALLTGIPPSGAMGGTISIITKRAGDQPLTRLGIDYASDTRFGVTADVGRRFGETGQWGLRFNGRRQTGETTIDDYATRSSLGALSLDYRGSNGLKVALDVVAQSRRDNRDRTGYAYYLYTDPTLPAPPDLTVNPTDPAARSSETNEMVQLTAQYQLTDRWDLFAGAGTGRTHYESIENWNYLVDRSGRLTGRELMNYDLLRRKQSYRAGLNGLIETGPILHQLTLSVDKYRNRGGSSWSTANPSLPDGNIYLPAVDSLASLQPGLPRRPYRDSDFDSFILADTLSMLDDRLRFTVGLRHQRIRVQNYSDGAPSSRYDRGTVTPTVGIVLKPRADASVYASVIEGLRQGGVAPSLATNPDVRNPDESLPPYKTRQFEVGLKYDGQTFGVTAALYRITQPSASVGPDNYFRVNGDQRHQGLEVVVFGELAPGIRLLGGFNYVHARLVETPNGALEGKQPIGVPAFQFKLTPEWDIPGIAGLTGWAGVRHTAKQYIDSDNTLVLPAYTLWDAGMRYGTRLAGKDVMLRASILNLANKKYWASQMSEWSILPGTSRTVLLSASVDF